MKTAKTAQLPPFYTQVIGSLPRPQMVRDLLAQRAEIPPERFARDMDDVARFAIRLQERAGLDVVSDGEWRRIHYIGEFLQRVGGFERCRRYEHQGEVKYTDVVVRRMEAGEPVFTADARFLVENTDCCTKFALPSPFLVAIRYWHENYSCHSVYRRRSDVKGDYKPILPRLQKARVDRVNLEFAYPDTGDVSDLELLPKHLGVGMGVVDVRTEDLQSIEQVEAIGAAGAALIGAERIALNPDCGFAPDAGEPPSIDEAYEKLRRLVEAASRLRERFARSREEDVQRPSGEEG